MRSRIAGLLSAGLVTILVTMTCGRTVRAPAYAPRTATAPTGYRDGLDADLDSLLLALDSLRASTEHDSPAGQRASLRRARGRYKRLEGMMEYLAPGVSGVLNGPLPEDDGDAPPRALGAPAAFQRIAVNIGGQRTASLGDIALVQQSVRGLRNATQYVHVDLPGVLAATRMEIARVATLGIAGFDAATPDDALFECAEALDGMRLQLMRGRAPRLTPLLDALDRASVALRHGGDFNAFDRLDFVVRFANPAAVEVAALRRSVAGDTTPIRLAWRKEAATVFEPHAFDATAYAPEFAPAPTAPLAALGKRMFFDANLSGARAQSCATCHNPDKAFTDGRARSATFGGGTHGAARNTPTLVNAALQPELFADERAKSLEDQVGKVLASPSEMQSSADLAATRLRTDASYRSAFRATLHDSVLTELSVRVALAAYIRSLTSLDSRFDRAIRGDALAMNAEERHGFTLFMGKARCGSCHFAPLFNGTMPPDFVISEPEIIGVPRSTATRSPIDGDIGRAAVDGITQHRFAFKVPTLRNIALTAPYMHNGVYRTLDEVVAFYDRGGSRTHPTPTLAPDSLHLTRDERSALVAFMRSLTDTTFIVPAASRRR